MWQRGDSNDIEIKSRGADYLRNMDSWFVGFFSPGDSNLHYQRSQRFLLRRAISGGLHLFKWENIIKYKNS